MTMYGCSGSNLSQWIGKGHNSPFMVPVVKTGAMKDVKDGPKFLHENVAIVWNEETGDRVEVGPSRDEEGQGLLEIRSIARGNIPGSTIALEPEQALEVAKAIVTQAYWMIFPKRCKSWVNLGTILTWTLSRSIRCSGRSVTPSSTVWPNTVTT